MAAGDPTPRLVRLTPAGKLKIEIDKYVSNQDGTTRRVRIRRTMPAGTSEREAHALAAKLERDLLVRSAAIAPADGWAEYVTSLSETPKSWLYSTIKNVQHRSRARSFECTLTIRQLREIMLRCRGRCEVTGLRFITEPSAGLRSRPFFHSLDRIDASKGYTVDNLRMVCVATNYAMNAWGEQVFAEIARGYVFNRYSAFYAAEDGQRCPHHHIP